MSNHKSRLTTSTERNRKRRALLKQTQLMSDDEWGDASPTRIIRPAASAPRLPIRGPVSVFHLGVRT